MRIMIIAVDGYASTGKSTVAKRVAARLDFVYIDTGAMYRAVTLEALRRVLIVGGEVDEQGLKCSLKDMKIGFRYSREHGRYETYVNGECVEDAIRGMEVSAHVSGVAALGFVREYLVAQQREMGKRGNVIMDGRDIGSVVFPEADVKFFMTASPEIRAGRRYRELREKGMEVEYAEVEANVRERDDLDAHREVSPLKPAEDAVVIDNSGMSIEEVVELMIAVIGRSRCGGCACSGGEEKN